MLVDNRKTQQVCKGGA